MIILLNRKELLLTHSLEQQAKVREILQAEEIDYDVKTRNSQNRGSISSRRGQHGSFGMNMDAYYEYRIFVKKADYERAEYLIMSKL